MLARSVAISAVANLLAIRRSQADTNLMVNRTPTGIEVRELQ